MAKIVSDSLFEALREAGLADTNTRRVVIDIQARGIPVVYIEKYGDEKLLQVVTAMAGADIQIHEGGPLPEWEMNLRNIEENAPDTSEVSGS